MEVQKKNEKLKKQKKILNLIAQAKIRASKSKMKQIFKMNMLIELRNPMQ